MNPAELRDQCLSFPGAEETFPFGPKTSVFKVAGKMFALSQLGADSLRVSLKCEPQLAEALRGAHASVLPGYHLNKRHWNTVIIDGSLPDDAIRDMIEDSYDLVVSKLREPVVELSVGAASPADYRVSGNEALRILWSTPSPVGKGSSSERPPVHEADGEHERLQKKRH
jgi:predicted DNA-binding protein (MmcQ/YjbR family)